MAKMVHQSLLKHAKVFDQNVIRIKNSSVNHNNDKCHILSQMKGNIVTDVWLIVHQVLIIVVDVNTVLLRWITIVHGSFSF